MLQIRKMTRADAPALAGIEKICFSCPWSENAFLEECDSPLSVFLVCECDGETAGYGGMQVVCGEGQIANIAVLPGFRRRGIAGALLSALEERAREQGAEVLELEVRRSNAGAIALYLSSGFENVGVRRGYYSLPREDALLMNKVLK